MKINMICHVKEGFIKIENIQMDYITFEKGTKPLIMIQGLNTRGIKGAGMMLAMMYRIYAKEHKVYLFDRRAKLPDEITVRGLI